MIRPASSDIFCNVVDNYGDIGVCWRLARQLANEYGLAVRLWVDDLCSFAKLCAEADPAADRQMCHGVEVRHWTKEFPVLQPAELVIEAFSCKLPQSYMEAMAEQQIKSAWINLEYLSAEEWVESHHKLPSPHPSLPLTKYYFFPGFTKQTGGLLLERDLQEHRKAFLNSPSLRQEFWRSAGMGIPPAGTLVISMFAYENTALEGLFDACASGNLPIWFLVPEGRILPQVSRYFGDTAPAAGKAYANGNLNVRVLPFVEQAHYDELLWACDVNFVRGEDSCVRAQWAEKPFIWQIYPQHDAVHLKKLEAFLTLYCDQLGDFASQAVHGLWKSWNSGGRAEQAWPAFISACGELERHGHNWARHLAENNLALNLLDFSREIGRMRAFEIEGQ